jgi:microcystin-dependent protein
LATFFLGQIIIGGWNFAPQGSVQCNGQTLAIAQYNALFALLGTTYGGNGVSTFQLPNLQGRRIVHWGNGVGLAPYVIGQNSGVENVSVLQGNMPTHNHQASFAQNNSSFGASGTTSATAAAPAAGGVLGVGADLTSHGAKPAIYVPSGSVTNTVGLGGLNVAGTVSLGVSGNGLPLSILNPYNTVTMCIATVGIFPTRN